MGTLIHIVIQMNLIEIVIEMVVIERYRHIGTVLIELKALLVTIATMLMF